MNDLLAFIYISLLVFVAAWFVQIGAHPHSARATFSAIVMTITIMLIAGSVILTVLNLILRAWS